MSSYPPPDHYLSDLGGRVVLEGDHSHATLDVTDALCGVAGGVRLGVLATLIDMCAGGLAGSRAAPDWVATSDMSIHLAELVSPGPCRVECRLVRHGRFLVVMEQDLVIGPGGGTGTVGRASAAFSILPSRGESQGGRKPGEGARELQGGSRADDAVLDRIGGRVVDAAAGEVEVELSDYIRNTFGALQGGVVAVLCEAGIEAATDRSLQDLTVRYLALGREGPFRTEVQRMPTASTSGEEVVKAVIRDLGNDGRMVASATGRTANWQLGS